MPLAFPIPNANAIRQITTHLSMVKEKDVDVPLRDGGLVRANVYRPLAPGRYPVLMTYGPYGKDFPYADFHVESYSQIPDDQKGSESAWETPHPDYWTSQGYVVVRADERGIGSSPGFLDTMSDQTSSDFAEVIEWAAEQDWSNGRVGLLGISYFGGSQWRVAARKPKGLAAIVPWEGMSDYYRDRVRQGGILSNQFIKFWWDRQVVTMQYGNSNKAVRTWGPNAPLGNPHGPECVEGTLSAEELVANRNDQTIDTCAHSYLDEPYFKSKDYSLADIEVPILSVANLGGITLHLRGNCVGYMEAGSKNKWLWFISGRHDLPFYLPHYVQLQKSFLGAFLKGEDDRGWLEGPNAKVPAVNLLVREGNPGFNSNEAEATFTDRPETSWPIERTTYTKFHLHPSPLSLSLEPTTQPVTLEIDALGEGEPLQFKYTFSDGVELAGHSLASLAVSVKKRTDGTHPKDVDLFVTLRHLDPAGEEVLYTGTAGDPVPLCKGWLRASLRAIAETDPRHRDFLPRRDYTSKDVAYLEPDTAYNLLIELWPTAVKISPGGSIVFEVATGDTQGCGVFFHNNKIDRSEGVFAGANSINFGSGHDNWIQLPII